MSDELDKLEQLFHAALERGSPEERASFLAQACGADRILRQRVESLLQSHETAGQFLESETSPASNGLPSGDPEFPPSEKPGDQIGHYTLLERIGEGGCCVVYRAAQIEPVRRQVALKLIKAGMDTRQVVARFQVERQALALMDHPDIAKVFDAGVTAHGRPYFVMELVRGVPITKYCDQHRLGVKPRLDLFIQVCQAVQHAHQKGIIHRDLKPSNILVTDNHEPHSSAREEENESRTAAGDGILRAVGPGSSSPAQPAPKIIDFGIAKAIQTRLADRAIVTWAGEFIGTPAYMSPEQARMTSEDIDARADIYSLGALLYELLTGTTPFDQGTLAEAPFDEIQRLIQETEPLRPSARLAKAARAADAPPGGTPGEPGGATPALPTGVKPGRTIEHQIPQAKAQELRGDLDWIVMKALQKDRQRRYATVNDLAEDIQRHLAHEPVLAGPPTALYRTQKFVQRHRLGVAAATLVILALVTGLSLALVGLQRARRAEVAVRQQRDRAVQAEADVRRMLELFADQLAADDEMIVSLHTITRLAREQLGTTNRATLSFVAPLAQNFGRRGGWSNALELYLVLIEADPNNSEYWQCAHAAAFAAGQADASRRLRQRMVDQFASSPNLTNRLRLAKALLMPANGQGHRETAFECSCQAVQAKPEDDGCQMVRGMAEYRRSNWSEALKWLEKAERSRDPTILASACYFGAMARQRLGQTNQARQALTRASEPLQAPLETGQLPAKNWQEWMLALVARAEAERLVLGQEVSPPLTAEMLAQARAKWKSEGELLLRADDLARQEKWRQSRDLYARVLKQPSFDWDAAEAKSSMGCLSLQMAIVFVRSADRASYEELCRMLLELHPEKSDERNGIVRAERYAKICFLDAQSLPPDLRQGALDLARFAVAQRQKGDHHPGWILQSGAIAEFYAGRPETALERLLTADDFGGGAALAAISKTYRAMVLQKLNRAPEAAQALQEVEELFNPGAPIWSSLLWWDQQQLKLALEQARQLIRP
jgi:eukaryotic-like serine/threonine-protein kinase